MKGKRKSYRYVTSEDRQIISRHLNEGTKITAIARIIGMSPDTVYREINRGITGKLDEDGNTIYDPELAENTVKRNFQNRGKPTRLIVAAPAKGG
ncbi:hypothetical protein FACS18949_16510 [Clostridia bacterium]|nr:hypothetical protein FACS18949_16510 [Clostridia bacterium]